MARGVNKLSALAIGKMKQPGYYGDGAGLYLQVSKSGTKSWLFKFMLQGRNREMGLGSVNTISLAEARDLAAQQRKLLRDGIDPIAARDKALTEKRLANALRITFADAVDKFIEAMRAEWKNAKHADQWRNTLATYTGAILGPLPVSEIDTALVLRCLEPIWTTKTETATRVRGRIERVLDWATVKGYRTGENPARWRGHLENTLAKPNKAAKVEHHPALPYEQVAEFIKELQAQTGVAARALEFTILTAARTGEVIGGRWEEFDADKALWRIPAERMKAKKDHVIPLSARAHAILVELREASGSDYLFPGMKERKPLSNMAMLAVLERMGRTDITVHGFRSTFRDWAGETTAYPREVIEHALAHQIPDKAEAAYARGTLLEKRRRLMEDWATYCNTARGEGSNVVPLQGKTAA